jgi:serine beta-lactamase-like protein LACTB
MNRAVVTLLLLTGCATSPAVPIVDHSVAITESRASLAAIASAGAIPGMSIAVTSGDAVVWTESVGHSNVETATPIHSDTRFRIGSVSKLLTVTALLRLVDQGRLQLDEPVSQYLPDFKPGDMTIRQLAAHLGGIRHYAGFEFMNTKRYATLAESLEKFSASPMAAAPGTTYVYSSYGYNLLGGVMEKASGKPFVSLIEAEVLSPLGMTDTSAYPEETNASQFYEKRAGVVAAAPAIDLSDRLPSGGYLSTAGDLARLAIGTTSPRYLSAASRQLLLQPQKTSDGKEAIVSVGWRVGVDELGRTFLHHGGNVTGGRAFLLVYPAERVGVAIVSNLSSAPFAEQEAGAIARRFLSSPEQEGLPR